MEYYDLMIADYSNLEKFKVFPIDDWLRGCAKKCICRNILFLPQARQRICCTCSKVSDCWFHRPLWCGLVALQGSWRDKVAIIMVAERRLKQIRGRRKQWRLQSLCLVDRVARP